jgi:hypothetical protein
VGSAFVDGNLPSPTLLLGDPPSQPYSETDPSLPEPTHLPRFDNKMHQTSSRLLRMTDDDRPYTKVSGLETTELAVGVHATPIHGLS